MQIRKIKNPLKKYAFLLLASAIFGVNFLSIDLGFFQLSIYRILILLSPLLYFLVSKETKHNLRKQKNYLYFQFLLIWTIYSVITLLWIQDFAGWVRIFLFLLCGCITSWFIGWYFSAKNDWITALKLIEIFAFVFGLLGIYEILTGDYLFIPLEKTIYYEERSALDSSLNMRIPISVFGNPNNFSHFFLFAVFGSLTLFKVKSTNAGRLLSLAFLGYFIFLLMASQSRSGFLGLLIGWGILILVYLKRSSYKNRIITILIGLITLMIVFSWLIANKIYFERLLTFDFSKGSDQTRVHLLKNGMIFLANSMLLGVGLGNIEYHMAVNGSYFTGEITNIHNWWMEILVSSGIFIFIFYIFVYIKSMIRIYYLSLTKKDKEIRDIATFFLCFLGAFIISAIGSSSLMIAEWFWPIMAVIMSFANSGSKTVLTSQTD